MYNKRNRFNYNFYNQKSVDSININRNPLNDNNSN